MRRLALSIGLPMVALLLIAAFAEARIAGVFKAIPVTDADAKKAADFAVKAATAEEKKTILLKKLKTAEFLAPNMSYRLVMDVTVDGAPSGAMAVVLKLDKGMEMSRWKLFQEEK